MSSVESLHSPNLHHHLSAGRAEGHAPSKPSQTRQPRVPWASPGLIVSIRQASSAALEAWCATDTVLNCSSSIACSARH